MAQSSHSLPRVPVSIDSQTILDRARGIVTFNRTTVASIAADRRATIEAGIVVAVVGLASGIGFRSDVAPAIVAALVGWVGLAAAVWFIADRFMSTPTSREAFPPLLRVIGYAQAPAILGIIHFVWALGPLIAGIGTLWSVAVTIFAVRSTSQFGWVRAIALAIAGGLIVNVLGFILAVTAGIDPQIW